MNLLHFNFRRTLPLIALAFTLLFVAGCHSAFIEATVINNSGAAITLLEVDYPSASFGQETLAAGAAFHYRFKVLGQGPTKVLWTDTAKHDHSVSGPALDEHDEGQLLITITAASAQLNYIAAKH